MNANCTRTFVIYNGLDPNTPRHTWSSTCMKVELSTSEPCVPSSQGAHSALQETSSWYVVSDNPTKSTDIFAYPNELMLTESWQGSALRVYVH